MENEHKEHKTLLEAAKPLIEYIQKHHDPHTLELKELGFNEECVARWFREKYGLYSELFVDDGKTFGFLISSFIEDGRLDNHIQRQFTTYEEAELACLKKLIEIVKNK